MGPAQTPPDHGEDIRRYCDGGWWPTTSEIGLFNPANMRTTRYRYRGTAIPTPWSTTA
jgi:RNA-directed DNA polymerase